MDTLPSIVRNALREPREAVLLERIDGDWRAISNVRLLERIEAAARALRMQCQPGERVILMAGNSVDWIVANFAILFARCVSVPIYPNQTIEHVRHIIEECEPSLMFVDAAVDARISAARLQTPRIILSGRNGATLTDLELRGLSSNALLDDEALQPDDLALLAYTSGTTGIPKGVMLTHGNIARNVIDGFSYAFASVRRGEPVLSVLPFSHVYEHMLLYGYMLTGTPVYITRDPSRVLADLRSVKPVVMATVPRILTTILSGIITRARSSRGPTAYLLPWALAAGRDYKRLFLSGKRVPVMLRLQYAVARALVLKKLRPLLGLERLRFLPCGSAPLHLDTLLMLAGADIEVVEGYGLSECSPLVSVNLPGANRPGTVGKPIPNVAVRIASDGEIEVRGPNVMRGYYHNAEATAAALDAGGWLHTGDVGEVDEHGYLRITDRKNDLFKAPSGEFVAPARIENAIRRSPLVREAMVVAAANARLVALVEPNWDLVRSQCRIDLHVSDETLSVRPDVRSVLQAEVAANTADLAPGERVRRVAILPRSLTVEAGEYSPTFKLRRRTVAAEFRDLIDAASESK